VEAVCFKSGRYSLTSLLPIVVCLSFGWRYIPNRTQKPPMVIPVHPHFRVAISTASRLFHDWRWIGNRGQSKKNLKNRLGKNAGSAVIAKKPSIAMKPSASSRTAKKRSAVTKKSRLPKTIPSVSKPGKPSNWYVVPPRSC